MDRLTDSAIPHARGIRRDLVEYVPKRYAGDMGAFRKFETFAWQNEFRVGVDPLVARAGHIDLTMGSIGDIAELLPMSVLPGLTFHRA